jgi:hypothetical protein
MVARADAASYRHLDPGRPASLRERVPVNVVFIGIERDAINQKVFEKRLPSRYRPEHRIASAIQEKAKPLGLSYTYDYRLHFAPTAYENAFFTYLARKARTAPLTGWQHRYNAQFGRLDIDTNVVIDAPSVERWFAMHPPAGLSTTQNTVFFIDWFGRKGFRFHVYDKQADPDSDVVGLDATSLNQDSEFYVAWGGTAANDPEDGRGLVRRVWFYDLSAGPDYYSGNWDVTSPDDGLVPARRIPPVWEYGPGGFHETASLTDDLAALTRYVAIDLLFTPSPLYPILSTKAGIPSSIDLDMNFYDLPGLRSLVEGSSVVVRRAFERLAPWIRFSAEADAADPLNVEHAACYAQWFGIIGPSCYLDRRYAAEANLMLFHSRNRQLFFDRDSEYEAGGFVYHGPGNPLINDCYATSDYDYVTGAQSFVYMFRGATCEAEQRGSIDFLTHEFGHHLGLSHPHDGYDSEETTDFGPFGEFAFAYVGTEVNSVMSYTLVNNDFGQFDIDNLARWWTEAYVRSANVLAGKLVAARRTSSLARADVLVGTASSELANHRYLEAVGAAKRAYGLVRDAARAAGIATATPAVGGGAVLGDPETRRSSRSYRPAVDLLCGDRFCLPEAPSAAATFSQRR